MKRRESWRGGGRSGRWSENQGADSFEMQDQMRGKGVSRRSVSRQSK